MRCKVAALMPTPVSLNDRRTKPGLPATAADSLRALIVSVPPRRSIASRAVHGDVENRQFKLRRVGIDRPQVFGKLCLDANARRAMSGRAISRMATICCSSLICSGLSVCLREKASSCRVSSLARSAARRMPSSIFGCEAQAIAQTDDFQPAADDLDEVVEVVRQPACELADGLHFLALPAQCSVTFDALTLGHVDALKRQCALCDKLGKVFTAARKNFPRLDDVLDIGAGAEP